MSHTERESQVGQRFEVHAQTPAPASPPPVPYAVQLQQLLTNLGTGRPITYKNVEVKLWPSELNVIAPCSGSSPAALCALQSRANASHKSLSCSERMVVWLRRPHTTCHTPRLGRRCQMVHTGHLGAAIVLCFLNASEQHYR